MRGIVERLNENIIYDAFERRAIVDGALCERLIRERKEAAEEITRLRAEIETLRRDVRTAVMGDSAELQDVKRENEKLHREAAICLDQIEREQEAHLKTIADFNKQAEMNGRLLTENAELREALKPFAYYASQIPNDVSDTASASGTVGDLRAAAAAIRESEIKL